MKDSVLYQAIDGLPLTVARNFIADLAGVNAPICGVKAHDLYDRHGCVVTGMIEVAGFKPWIDLKLHDVPRTVGRRAQALFENGAGVITVMAKGGIEMMEEAVFAATNHSPNGKIYAVTVLTSLSEEEYGQPILPEVIKLAKMAAEAGAHGVVCSGQEVGELSQLPELKVMDLVVPGTRLPGGDVKDQKRVVTQYEAIKAGATHLVIGSEVTEADDPAAVLRRIQQEVDRARLELQPSAT